jgi:FkbM family methyltransferase
VPLPAGGRSARLDLVEPNSTAVQRHVRRHGLGNYERPTLAAMLAACEFLDPGFVLFDVDANMGLYGAVAASMFSPRVVHAFEPTPATAAVARRIATRNRLPIDVHEVALSDTQGTASLHISPVSDASNSLVEGFRETDVRIDVTTTTLDEFVRISGDRPDIVKIDVETHERAVLDGARATIRTHRPIIIVEVLHRRGHDHGVEITEFLDGLDYGGVELSATPIWTPREVVSGSGTDHRDWLLLPAGLPIGFDRRWQTWDRRLAECGVQRNPTASLRQRALDAYRRGGWSGLIEAGGRYRRRRSRDTS